MSSNRTVAVSSLKKKFSRIFYLSSILFLLFSGVAIGQESDTQTFPSSTTSEDGRSPRFGGPDSPDVILL